MLTLDLLRLQNTNSNNLDSNHHDSIHESRLPLNSGRPTPTNSLFLQPHSLTKGGKTPNDHPRCRETHSGDYMQISRGRI